jgi:hypothetical protein
MMTATLAISIPLERHGHHRPFMKVSGETATTHAEDLAALFGLRVGR